MSFIIGKIIGEACRRVKNYYVDNTFYKKSTSVHIEQAIQSFNKGHYETALQTMEALADQIDFKNFHRYATFQYRKIKAREEYNRLCIYIARIYSKYEDYSKVKEWANKLAFIPNWDDIIDWRKLLHEEDFNEIQRNFDYYDDDQQITLDVMRFENEKYVQ